MAKKFLKKIIAQNQQDLRVISALCSEAKIKQTEIKFLKKNKVFLLLLERENKEKINSKDKINSIVLSILLALSFLVIIFSGERISTFLSFLYLILLILLFFAYFFFLLDRHLLNNK